MMYVHQVIDVIVSVLNSSNQRSRCPPVTANALLYIAELCASVKLHVIPLLPLLMPAIIDLTADLAFLTRSVLNVHCESKKTAPIYFCNNFVKPSTILIIFGMCVPW